MRYTDFLGIKQGFQASINLEYDLNNIEKIKSYIPTEQSVQVIGDFLHSYYYSNGANSRATVLVGPYGRGKSHLLLVLSALTSLDLLSDEPDSWIVLEELCDKITNVNSEVGHLAKSIVNSHIRTLPVIINSNSADINQAFLLAINSALLKAGLQELLPSTYFDSALSIIEKWSDSFPKAYKTLQNELRKEKTSIDEFCIGLKQYDSACYSMFCSIYPKITAGTEFNPLMNMDVVKMYSAIAVALKEQTAYSGITIIFDEFSKYLESNLDSSRMYNFKIIQDMAEASVRSRDAQLHFICVTHKDILDYSSSDSFKTVSGRFKEIRLVSSSEQSYELIANAITKTPFFEELKVNHAKEFQQAKECYSLVRCFSDLEYASFENKIVYGCFPLAPLSSYALLHVSELVGQNERTLFSFLSMHEKHALYSFIQADHDTLEFITVESIYDYFEELFRKEVFNKRVYLTWSKAISAIKKANGTDEINIIKAIAIINIIADDNLRPIASHIKSCLMMSDEVFSQAIKSLIVNQVISERGDNSYVLLTADEISINAAIQSLTKAKIKKLNICEVLSQSCNLGFVIPREYNDKYSMLRFFRKVFMDAGTFLKTKNKNQLLVDSNCDGLIIHIIDKDNSSQKAVIEMLQRFNDAPNIIICLSKLPFSHEELLKKYVAISELKEKNRNDEEYIKELELIEEDVCSRIRSVIDSMFAPFNANSTYYNCNGEMDITNNVTLIKEVSRICEETYYLTPVINNEMVNKRVLNSQNLKGRDLVVSWLLKHADENVIPVIPGYGPEVSVFNSVFKHTGLYKTNKVNDPGLTSTLNVIKEFITGCEKKQRSFYELYQILSFPPYSIRKGLIPLFIVYVIRQYLDSVVLYFKNKEVELSASVLSSLNDNPENYYLLIETGTQEKEEYLEKLEELFRQYSDTNTISVNKCYSVVKSMQNWIRSLPEYTKKFVYYYENGQKKSISNSVIVIRRELLKYEINANNLLFNALQNGIGCNSLSQSFKEISLVKLFLDSHLKNSCNELQFILKGLFVPNYQGSLSSAIISWYQDLPDNTKIKVFDSNTNSLLAIAKNNKSYDDDSLLEKLIITFTSIGIADWNDSLFESFICEVTEAVSRINSYRETEGYDNKCVLSIHLADGIHEKSFSLDSISPLGQTALNNLRSVIEEYNDALEPDEQLAILSQLIEDIIQ